MEPLLKPKEAAKLLSIGTTKLWSLTNSGEISSVKIGRAVRYRPSDLEVWIQRKRRPAV